MIKTLVILIIFYFFATFLFTYKLTDVPPGINGDEAAIGYLAAKISKTSSDTNGKFLPIFATVSWPDWKQPITLYATVILFKLFGISYFNLRFVSVIFVLLSGIIIYFLAEELFNIKLAIFSLFIYSTIPIIMIQSHLALENIAPLPFIAFWLWMLAKYANIKKTKYLILSGLAMGLSVYSYLGLRLIMPVLTILSIGYIYYLNYSARITKRHWFPVLVFIISVLPSLFLLFIIRHQYPGAIFALNHPGEIISYQQFLLPYLSSFDFSFLFLKGDLTPYHSTGKQGMFLLATLPLFILGIVKIIRDTKPFLIFILISFFMMPIFYGFPGSIYRASRLLSEIPAFIIITTTGFQVILQIRKQPFQVITIVLLIVIVILNYLDFISDYWFNYSNRVNQNFEKPLHKVFGKVARLSGQEKLEVYMQDDVPLRNQIAYQFFEDSYFPNGWKIWKEGQRVPNKSIIMVSSQVYHWISRPNNIEVIDNGDIDLNLFINR